MKTRNRFKDLFVTNSLRFQLLSRSLLLMAVLLGIIGLFQYVFMREFIYQNKASSIQDQIKSVPPDAWALMASNSSGSPSSLGIPDIPGSPDGSNGPKNSSNEASRNPENPGWQCLC